MFRRSMEMAAKIAAQHEQKVVGFIFACLLILLIPNLGEAGKIAGIISSLAHLPYILSILRRDTRPSKVSWLIWAVLEVLICSSYYMSGARETMWVPLTNVVAFTAISVLAFCYGEDGWDWTDWACLFGATLGLALWYIFQSSFLGLLIFMGVDLIAGVVMIKKSFQSPESEYGFAWFITLTGCTVNLFAVESWTLEIGLYPIVTVLVDGVITFLIFRKSIIRALRLE